MRTSNKSTDRTSTAADDAADDGGDFVWGLRAIGAEINRTEQQTQHMHARGILGGIVVKLWAKTVFAPRRKLRRLADLRASKPE